MGTVKNAGLAACRAFAGRRATGVSQEEDKGKCKGEDACDEKVAAEVTNEECGVYTECLDEEAADAVQAHVE